MAVKVAINGFGRIGRAFYKVARENKNFDIVAVNDLADIENLAYLLKYDSAYGIAPFDVVIKDEVLLVGGKKVQVFHEMDPAKLPWGDLGIDIVVESTGVFATYEKASVHLTAGAKRVVITAPVKDDPSDSIQGETVLMGINDEKLKTCPITSNASCTTNAGSPVMQILHEALGIEHALLNTVHGYTASQEIVDGPSKRDFRAGRAGAQNIVPSSTGAAIAVTKAIPDLIGKFDGISLRVPILVGSIADITFVAKRETTAEEVNEILLAAAKDARWEGIFTTTSEPLVSSDIVGNPHASIADLSFTRVVGGNLVRVLAWYDNEMGYSHILVKHVEAASAYL